MGENEFPGLSALGLYASDIRGDGMLCPPVFTVTIYNHRLYSSMSVLYAPVVHMLTTFALHRQLPVQRPLRSNLRRPILPRCNPYPSDLLHA